MKNMISGGMIVLMAALFAAPAAQAQYSYTTNADGTTITITGYRGPPWAVAIPETISNLPVASIGDWAFYSTGVINVTIPDTVTNIGDGAFFDCESLTNVTIGDNIASIGDWAFGFCSSLTNVNFRGNAPGLGGVNVFYGDSASVNYLPGTAGWGPTFGGLSAALWNPPVPYNYTTNNETITITRYTGSGGAAVIPTTINFLPVTSIGQYAFYECGLTSVTIPGSVTNIGGSAFEICYRLTNATFANGVLSIGSNAFLQCLVLPSVTIPATVTNIAAAAFAACPDLAAITVDAQNAFYSSVNGILFDKTQTTLVQCPGGTTGSYTIPGSVTCVGDSAFAGCALTSVTIPAGVTSIGDYAFDYCTNLTSIAIPGSVTSIGDFAFESCHGLTNVTIPTSLTSIGNSVFENCTSLSNVTIPGSITSIGEGAFGNCSHLSNMTIPASVTYFVGNAFGGCHLTNVYLQGNAPSIGSFGGPNLGPPLVGTVYYLPGTTGWSNSFDGRPAVLWNPLIQTGDGSFGVRNNQFGFNITGTTNIPIVVEACSNLASPVWIPLQSLTLTNGSYYFSEPFQPGSAGRYYRIGSQ